jgi:hypothetical protein
MGATRTINSTIKNCGLLKVTDMVSKISSKNGSRYSQLLMKT